MDKEKISKRVVMVSGINGWTVALLAIAGTLFTLVLGAWFGVVIGLLITGSGLMELKGRKMLKDGRAEAGKWLSTSQLWLMSVIIGYSGYQMFSFDLADMLQAIPLEQIHVIEESFGLPPQAVTTLVSKIYYGFYFALIIASLLYQGSLWFYYRKSMFKLIGQ